MTQMYLHQIIPFSLQCVIAPVPMYRQGFDQAGAFFQCFTETLTPADDFEKLNRRVQTFGSENAFSANLVCSSAQTVECAADRREFTPAVAFPETISESICHLPEFNL